MGVGHFGGVGLQQGVYTTNGAAAKNGTRCRNHGHCTTTNGNGRLQKSLSFAFQNPAMWDDVYGGLSSCGTAPHVNGTASGSASGGYNYATYRPTSR